MTAINAINLTDQGAGGDRPADLLRALVEESRELTAVERFAKSYDEGGEPAQAKHYRDLIPLSAPAAGEQYAFEVDLGACSGCKACVSACHHMNGLEPTETWRSVGQLHGVGPRSDGGLPIIQHVTTACHHCVDPGCLSGCPTNAYEKDPGTGIVRHLDDQCFGCQYCTMACPYEVPQYSESKGIVRKCDMCQGRLTEGEAPACVQACPNQAIKITVVDVAEAVAKAKRGDFLPSSPPPQLTKPTTIYRGERSLPGDVKAADADHASPQHAHLPLVFMLVFTQLSVGAVAAGSLARWLGAGAGAEAAVVAGVAAALFGLSLAPLHLGRPHLAFRSVLGWRHSWLSREAIVFGLYAPFGIGAALFAAMPLIEPRLPESMAACVPLILPPPLRPLAEVLAVFVGVVGIYCSAKIYIFTGRVFWRGGRTYAKFGGTAAVLGAATLLATAALAEAVTGEPAMLSAAIAGAILATLGKLAYEANAMRTEGAVDAEGRQLHLSTRLMLKHFGRVTTARFAFAILGGVLLPLGVAVSAVGSWSAAVLAVAGLGCLVAGELAERVLYFGAVAPLRMPGGVKS